MATKRERRLYVQPYSPEKDAVLDLAKGYPDDSIARVRDLLVYLYKTNKAWKDNFTLEATVKLQEALLLFDERAVKKHGYSGSAAERDVDVPPSARDVIDAMVDHDEKNATTPL